MNTLSSRSHLNRRQFLAATGAALATPLIVPSRVLGAAGQTPPSERITMGVVGWGMMGPGNTGSFMAQQDCQVVAACDLDQEHLDQAVNAVNVHYKNRDCKAYHDYRELMARDDIDAVMLAVTDQWPAIPANKAAGHTNNIYGANPLHPTIAEQQAIVQAVQRHQRIWQTGSWQRSVANFHKAAEIVRSGLIGKVSRVEVGLPSGHHDFAGTGTKRQVTDPPARLDYDFWIGPSRMMPYIEEIGRAHV